MEVRIETDGYASHTRIFINGREVKMVKSFSFSVAVSHRDERGRKRGGACKMQVSREVEDGRIEPLEYYGGGFEKFDEENLWKETGYVGNNRQNGVGKEVSGGKRP